MRIFYWIYEYIFSIYHFDPFVRQNNILIGIIIYIIIV